eukprot:Selendium_serpulae@DN6476_c0_g2_i1.p2
MVAGAVYKSHLLPIAVGIVVTILHYVFQRSSGSHFNPAISWAMWIADPQQLSSVASTVYVTVQYLAGALASHVCFGMAGRSFYYAPTAPYTVGQALAVEVACTSLACGTMLYVATIASKDWRGSSSGKQDAFTRAKKRFASSCLVGAAAALSVLMSINISGACLNPAAYWGAVSAHIWREGPHSVDWSLCIPYYLGPYTGATLIGLIVRCGFRKNENRLESKWSDLENFEDSGDKIEATPLLEPVFK